MLLHQQEVGSGSETISLVPDQLEASSAIDRYIIQDYFEDKLDLLKDD